MLQAVKGMNDILPKDTPVWQAVETAFKALMDRYSYQEIRFPIVENTDLFKRTIGDRTDIVEKEMYTFEDTKNGDSLTLRPEGTACCMRAGIEHGLFHNQIQRLWYVGPMFRHENPQKGRYRQFYQFGVEAIGLAGPDIDAEIILMMERFWKELRLSEHIKLELNSLGTTSSRTIYREALVNYLKANQHLLDEDAERRLYENPMRVLDSKNPGMQGMIANAPNILEYLDAETKNHFDQLCQILDDAGVNYVINPRLVRGLDYYTHTVFEWVTDALGAQNAVCAGGRFDDLIALLGGKATPGIGFAMGIERLIAIIEKFNPSIKADVAPHIYLMSVGTEPEKQAILLAEKLRTALPTLKLLMHCGGGALKNQFKKADKSGAKIALILGEEELKNNSVTIKFLREEKPQVTINQSQLENFLSQAILF